MEWRGDITRLSLAPAVSVTSPEMKTLRFGTPLPVDAMNINVMLLGVEAIQQGEHEVTVQYNFTYDRGSRGVPRGVPTKFDLWVANSRAADTGLDGTFITTVENNTRNGTLARRILTMREEDRFDVYFQVWWYQSAGNLHIRPQM